MRRQLIHVLAGVCTFVIGITAASLTYFLARTWTASEPALQISPPVVEQQKRTYRRGPAGDSSVGSFTSFYSSDGMNFTKWTVECRSPRDAERQLQNRLKVVNKIISRESIIDNNGLKTGEKIVALFSDKDPYHRVASLLWTEKEELFEVESSSLQNILKYRKDFKR